MHHTRSYILVLYIRVFVITKYFITKFYCNLEKNSTCNLNNNNKADKTCSYDRTRFNRSHGHPANPEPTVLESTCPVISPLEVDPVCTDSCANFCKVLSTNKNIKIHLKKLMVFFSQLPFTFLLNTIIIEHQLHQMQNKQLFPFTHQLHNYCFIIYLFIPKMKIFIRKRDFNNQVLKPVLDKPIVFSKGQFYFHLFCFILFK